MLLLRRSLGAYTSPYNFGMKKNPETPIDLLLDVDYEYTHAEIFAEWADATRKDGDPAFAELFDELARFSRRKATLISILLQVKRINKGPRVH